MFSFRSIIERVVNHGRKALFKTTQQHPTIFKLTESPIQESGRRIINHSLKSANSQLVSTSVPIGGRLFQYLGPVTSRFLQSIVRKVPSPSWIFAGRKTAQRLFGETAPYFALVGVTLVSGSEKGLLTEKDQLEALCGDIREAISRAGWIHDPKFWTPKTDSSSSNNKHNFSLADLELGPVIDKGCNAVVYSAKWKQPEIFENEKSSSTDQLSDSSPSSSKQYFDQAISTSLDNEPPPATRISQVEALDLNGLELTNTLNDLASISRPQHLSVSDDLHLLISTGFQRPTKKVKFKHDRATASSSDNYSKGHFPLALKMLFNYEAESNAPSILMAMKKELLPARTIQADIFPLKMTQLPPHSNVVDMPCVFVDRVPLLEGGLDMYPQALPKRIHSAGFGRNMSLFCVMKRYDCTLSDYLLKFEPSLRTSSLLFAQLLEAIQHLTKYSIAHRDLKMDNLLVDLSEGSDSPHLVVSDFGCCLATSSMKAPFPSPESDPRLGNLALMAPEVRGSVPGMLMSVDFGRCDLWAAGAIALQIFGLMNPFTEGVLNSLTYKEGQVPKLPKKSPSVLRNLVSALLRRNPHQRPTARVAATLAQLSLWAPNKWMNRHVPSHSEVTRWLLCVSTKVLCEAGTGEGSNGGRLEYEIVSSFLKRVHYEDIVEAISWFRSS